MLLRDPALMSRRQHIGSRSCRQTELAHMHTDTFVHFAALWTRCLDKGSQQDSIKEPLPVVYGASVIVVIAWHVSIKLAHAHSPEQAVVCDGNLALVILGALVIVVAWGAKGWDAYADTEGSKLRLDGPAEAWALVAAPKVVVTVLSAGCASLAWLRHASLRITVATAHATQHNSNSVSVNVMGW
jgi:hypothetical protein